MEICIYIEEGRALETVNMWADIQHNYEYKWVHFDININCKAPPPKTSIIKFTRPLWSFMYVLAGCRSLRAEVAILAQFCDMFHLFDEKLYYGSSKHLK